MYDMETADGHLIFEQSVEQAPFAAAAARDPEPSQRYPEAETFKRPLPRASFGGYGEARPDNLRRERQVPISSVYSERTPSLGHVLPSSPANAQAGLPHSTQRQIDPARNEVPMAVNDIGSVAQGTGPMHTAPIQPSPRLSTFRARQLPSGTPRSGSRPEPAPGSLSDAKLRAVHRHAPFVEELIHAFFARLHPYQLMFHQPTFQYRRYVKLVPVALLHMMYALAIRFIDPTTLRDVLVTEHASPAEIDQPLALAGEAFADEAKQAIQSWVKERGAMMQRASWSSGSLRTWEDLEMIMAITLYGFYEKAMMRGSGAAHFGKFTTLYPIPPRTTALTLARFTDIAINLLRDNLSMIASQDTNDQHPDAVTLFRCTERTLWMLYLGDVSSAVHVRPRQLPDYQMRNIPLPTDEAQFSCHGGGRTFAESSQMAYGVDALNLPGSMIADANISEFGHLIRSVGVATAAMAANANTDFTYPDLDSLQDHGPFWTGISRSSSDFEDRSRARG